MLNVFVEMARTMKREIFKRSDGPKAIKREFQRFHGRPLPDKPSLLTEKMYHRMIDFHHRKDIGLFTRIADKYLARDFITERVGADYLVGLLWQGYSPSNIPFDDLAYPCMAKTNHGSAMTMILRGPEDRDKAITQFEKWLEIDYYFATREYQYHDIVPRIMVEEFLDDGHPDGPLDYRFWCFNGEPALIQVDNNDHSINPFYDLEWNKVDICYRPKFSERDVAGPGNLDEMLLIARKLSAGFDFVRVDLYYVRGRIYVGELTFTPAIGQLKFKPESWDRKLGDLWP